MKKLIAMLMVIAMMLSVAVPVMAEGESTPEAAAPAKGIYAVAEDAVTVTVGDVEYQVIRTVADLNGMAASGKTNFILANDIACGLNVTDKDYAFDLPANAVFEGNGYCLSGIAVKHNSAAAFNGIGKTALTIRNLILDTVSMECTGNWGNAGSVFAFPQNTAVTLQGVVVKNGSITESSGNTCIGGLIGIVSRAKVFVENSSFSGSVTSVSESIVAAGGIIGSIENLNAVFTLRNCVNHGSVTGKADKTGGILGKCYGVGGGGNGVFLEKCVNTGAVSCKSWCGGMIGSVENSHFYIANCSNTGAVTAQYDASGFIGHYDVWAILSIKDSTNSGTITGTSASAGGFIGYYSAGDTGILLENLKNYGQINGGDKIGGIIGYAKGGYRDGNTTTLSNCLNYGKVAGKNGCGGLIGWTEGGAATATIFLNDCVNYGEIQSDSNAAGILAVINGYDKTTVNKVEVNRCANFGTVCGNNHKSGLINSCDANANLTVNIFLNAGTIVSNDSKNSIGLLGWCANNALSNITLSDCVNIGSVKTANITSSGVNLNNCYGFVPGVAGAADMTLAEAVAFLNNSENGFKEHFGGFMLNTAKTAVVPALPRFAGVQETAVKDGRQNVRLVAVISDTLSYSQVGFKLAIKGNAVPDQSCQYVYNSIIANESTGISTTVSAAELGGKYIYALTLTNLSAEGTVTIDVTPYAVSNEENGSVEFVQDTYTVTYVDGVFQGIQKKG